MDEPFISKIRCWEKKGIRSGIGFAVELRLDGNFFNGICQTESEATGTIDSIKQSGTIDLKKPYREFRIPKEIVLDLVGQLANHSLPVVPPISGGFDGHHVHLEISSGESSSHFSWFVIPPKEWTPLHVFWNAIVGLAPNRRK